MTDDSQATTPNWDKIERVIRAAVAYCEGTNPDDHPLDEELWRAVGELTADE